MQRLLAVIPQTPIGLRDRALILTLVLTGRRRAEVFDLKAGDLATENGRIYYAYRGKGGSQDGESYHCLPLMRFAPGSPRPDGAWRP